MLKLVSKFFLEILPSVAATVLGAYIVNHYINPKSGSDAPKPAAHSVASPGITEDQRASDTARKPEGAALDSKAPALKGPDVKTPDVAKGKSTADRAEKTVEKPSERPVEAAKETTKETTRRSTSREKSGAKTAPTSPVPVEAAIAPEERRDANELARAAIERLRTAPESVPQTETPTPLREPALREPAPGGLAVAPPPSQSQPSVQPLPPPVSVTTSGEQGIDSIVPGGLPPTARARSADANRPVPPAEIPGAVRPLDLQATAAPASKPSMADDVLSAARSVINAVVSQ